MNNIFNCYTVKRITALLFVILFVFCLSPFTYGADEDNQIKEVFVSEKADGHGDGTKESPFSDLFEAFSALPNGGTVHIIGKVNGYVPNAKLKKEDEDGNIIETDETDMYYIPYPRHSGRITVTSNGDGVISFENASSGFCFMNYGITEYENVGFSWGKGRPVFCSFGKDSHLKINENVVFLSDGPVNLYVCGFAEIYSGSFSHAFLTYDPYTPVDSGNINTALFIGKGASVETVWGSGLGRVSADTALVLLPGGTVGTVWGGGQAKHITGSFTFINHGGEVTGSVTADSNGGSRPVYSTSLGYEQGDNFSSYEKEYDTEFIDDKDKRKLYKNCESIITVNGKGNFIHIAAGGFEKLPHDEIGLFAHVFDYETEIESIEKVNIVTHVDMRLRSSICDIYFFAPYGTDYYAVAERPKTAEELENDDNPFTGDSITFYAFAALFSMLTVGLSYRKKHNKDLYNLKDQGKNKL